MSGDKKRFQGFYLFPPPFPVIPIKGASRMGPGIGLLWCRNGGGSTGIGRGGTAEPGRIAKKRHESGTGYSSVGFASGYEPRTAMASQSSSIAAMVFLTFGSSRWPSKSMKKTYSPFASR
jgi:hypothetical protein